MAGAIYGYARVSSRDQNLARQLNALEDFWDQLNTFCPVFVPIFKTEQNLHTTNVEFNYVAEGETHLCDISSGKIWRLSRGGVFIIGPNMPYATKHRQGTKVVFFKAPGGNDKKLVDLSPEIEEWLLEEI